MLSTKDFSLLISFLILILLGIENEVSAKADGGPTDEKTCATMIPQHGHMEPQKIPFPYTIYLSKSVLKAGESVKIQICSSKDKIKGFYLQARKEDYMNEMMPMGTFVVEEGYENSSKLAKCGGDKGQLGNTITHSNSMDKDHVKVQWVAPSTPGTYVILCTVAKNGGTFWAPQPSFKITVE